ncbi:MAG: M20/M25/M40 family metallo-hydrolase, partial [Hyphomicrobium sp.]|nr:M20/M25/M40 family metallo-hydrolase [Hyphomicrobium sp.]
MSTAIDQKVRAFLEGERDAQVRFLAEIVKIPTDNPPGDCGPAAERAAKLIEAFGWTVERHPVPDDIVKAAGMISCTNLIVRRTFGAGPTIALNAHGDVVPPGTGWTFDPYAATISNGWMYGRGAAVSKSDFATYIWALRALEASGAKLGGTIELHLTYDEETGGEIGPGYLLAQGLSKPDLAIGAGFSYAVVTEHNGCLHLEVEVTGRSAHAAKPWTGIDALQSATAILSALYAWRPTLATRTSKTPGIGAPQLTIGLI